MILFGCIAYSMTFASVNLSLKKFFPPKTKKKFAKKKKMTNNTAKHQDNKHHAHSHHDSKKEESVLKPEETGGGEEEEFAPSDDEGDLSLMLQRIQVRKSKIHGLGVFATKPIMRGQFIIEYVGEKISKAEGDRRSVEHPFIFILDDDHDLDGNVEYNVAKYMNHSCDPNAEFLVLSSREDPKERSVWIRAIKDIDIGEEILYDYHFDSSERHPCHCGAPNCRGWMNEVNDEEEEEEEEEDGEEEEEEVTNQKEENDDEENEDEEEENDEDDDPDLARVTTMTAEEIYDKLKSLGMIRTDLKVKRSSSK